ncbi:unnamed protein product, partial [Mesorhabditis belari]|uniref:Uncharacterized protein n=1 Tax=Mesorhabditis belari TaxID=2138241 RepID=A0AAF3FTZ5_9BILA
MTTVSRLSSSRMPAMYHSHQNIGKYQSILYCFLSFNIFFSALNSFTDVQFHVSGGHNRASCSLILVGAVNLDDELTSIILIYIFVFIFIEAVLMVTGQIIHRSLIIYKIIKPENTITTAFAILFITFCVLIIWIILFVMASITTTMCFDRSAGDGNNTLVDPNDPRCRDFQYKLMNIYDFNIATFVAIPFEIYNYEEQKLQLSLYAAMLFGFLCFLLIASICTVIVCSTLIIKKIKSSSFHLSQKNMHAEMLRTLLGQALSPILLLQLPLLISVIAIGVE